MDPRYRPLITPQLNDTWAPRASLTRRSVGPRGASYIVIDVRGNLVTLRRCDEYFHSRRVGIVVDRHHTLNFETLRRTYELVMRGLPLQQKPTGRHR